jgi:hypothetical protein
MCCPGPDHFGHVSYWVKYAHWEKKRGLICVKQILNFKNIKMSSMFILCCQVYSILTAKSKFHMKCLYLINNRKKSYIYLVRTENIILRKFLNKLISIYKTIAELLRIRIYLSGIIRDILQITIHKSDSQIPRLSDFFIYVHHGHICLSFICFLLSLLRRVSSTQN